MIHTDTGMAADAQTQRETVGDGENNSKQEETSAETWLQFVFMHLSSIQSNQHEALMHFHLLNFVTSDHVTFDPRFSCVM